MDAQLLINQLSVENDIATLEKDGERQSFEVKQLPEKFVRWQLDYKRKIRDAIERDEYVAFNAGHLPVVATWDTDSVAPNLANKGVGFTPKDEYLDHYLGLVEDAVEQIQVQ